MSKVRKTVYTTRICSFTYLQRKCCDFQAVVSGTPSDDSTIAFGFAPHVRERQQQSFRSTTATAVGGGCGTNQGMMRQSAKFLGWFDAIRAEASARGCGRGILRSKRERGTHPYAPIAAKVQRNIEGYNRSAHILPTQKPPGRQETGQGTIGNLHTSTSTRTTK